MIINVFWKSIGNNTYIIHFIFKSDVSKYKNNSKMIIEWGERPQYIRFFAIFLNDVFSSCRELFDVSTERNEKRKGYVWRIFFDRAIILVHIQEYEKKNENDRQRSFSFIRFVNIKIIVRGVVYPMSNDNNRTFQYFQYFFANALKRKRAVKIRWTWKKSKKIQIMHKMRNNK